MKKNWQNITNTGPCPSIDRLVLYHKGELSKEESLSIENHLASCEICNELLEGLSELKNIDSLPAIESELKQNLNEKLFKKESKKIFLATYQRIAIAASILLLIGISIFMYVNREIHVKSVSQNLPKESAHAVEKISSFEEVKSETKKEVEKPKQILRDYSLDRTKAPEKAEERKIEMSEIHYENPVSEKKIVSANKIQITDTVIAEPSKDISSVSAEEKNKNNDKETADEYQSMTKTTKAEKKKNSDKNLITGTVVDENGNPLPGVSVTIKGTTKGAVTDVNGLFSLNGTSVKDTLNLSSVGYKNLDVLAKNTKNPTIVMNEKVTAMNEVVVVGYGVQKKAEVAGAVSSVRSEDFKNEKNGDKRKINLQIDSLNKALTADKQNRQILISLIEKYLELQNKNEALDKLSFLYNQEKDSVQRQDIKDIFQLTTEEKYSKALKKLKKLN